MQCPSFSLVIVFILKSILSVMRIAVPAFFWFPFAWNIFFHPLTFSLYVSLGLKWVSCRQHIYGSCVFFVFLKLFIYLFISGCVGSSLLREGFLQLRQVGATPHRGAWAPPLSWPLLLRSTGSRRTGSAVVAHGPSCSAACGILPDQGSNPCPLHQHADSQPPRHQGSTGSCFCIHSASLCLLVGSFNPFIFKVIIDMYVPITIFIIVLGLLL